MVLPKHYEGITEMLRAKEILKSIDAPILVQPSTPELSFRPDFIVNLENRLTFVEISYLKDKETVDWKTLRLIEKLFEVKLFFGNKSVFTLVLLDCKKWKNYCLELLESFFDRVIYTPIQKATEIYAEPKINNFQLWDLERKFNNSRYKKLIEGELEQFYFKEISEKEIEASLYRKLSKFDFHPIKNYSVRNLKNYYLKEEMDLRFFFDFFANRKIIEVKTIRKMKMFILQNLLIKSRLIRYRKEDDKVFQNPTVDMVLFINGDIKGPEYDKTRYLRMLTNAGWDVFPITVLSNAAKLKEVLE